MKLARAGLAAYADTPSADAYPALLVEAEAGLKARQEADAARAAAVREAEAERAEAVRSAEAEAAAGKQAMAEAAALVRADRFRTYRDVGDDAFSGGDFLAAKLAYQKALTERDDGPLRLRLQECIDRTTRHRIAVADFKLTGPVGIDEGGRAVSELLLPKFGADRYQLVERSHLASILAEHDLSMAAIVDNPALLRGKKLAGVRYLVLGSIVKLGDLSISARLVDITTGDMIQTAEVTAQDARGLQNALGELANILQMTAAEKKTYLDDALYPQLLADARGKAEGRLYSESIAIYRRVLAIRPTLAIRDELTSTQSDKAAWEQLQAAQRRQERERIARRNRSREAYDRQMATARAIVQGMPADADSVTAMQKRELAKASQAVAAALSLMPADPAASALKAKIAKLLAGGKHLTLDCGGGVKMKLVKIPAGEFMMGSPSGEANRDSDEQLHRVRIGKPFYMGVYEVTQEQYEAVIGENPSAFKGAKKPVERVSWHDAKAFCEALSSRTGRLVCLPTEAEWEYACRAGTKTRFSFGDSDAALYRYGNYCDASNTSGLNWKDKKHNDGHDKTAPVGSYSPNAWGLYDMHGNVWEWCSDWYGKDYYAKANNSRDPEGPSSGSCRVIRGGSWSIGARFCRSAYRIRNYPGRTASSGFVWWLLPVAWTEKVPLCSLSLLPFALMGSRGGAPGRLAQQFGGRHT